MAIFPCSQGRHRYTGAARSAYPAVLGGELVDRVRLRFCGPHFFEYLANLKEKMYEVTEDTADDLVAVGRCYVCGAPIERRAHATAVVSTYDRGAEPQQWAQAVCSEHVEEAEQELFLRPLQGPPGVVVQAQGTKSAPGKK